MPKVVRTGTDPKAGVALDGIPVHPHVYGNGHVCLDLLGAGWSPVHTIMTVALSLQSMLAGNDKYGMLVVKSGLNKRANGFGKKCL